MAILDTSFIIDILHDQPAAVSLLKDLLHHEQDLSIPAPALMEVLTGVFLLNFPEPQIRKFHTFFSSLSIIDFDARAGFRAALLDSSLRRKGNRLQVVDMMISAMALERGEAVVTADEDFVRVPGLRIIHY